MHEKLIKIVAGVYGLMEGKRVVRKTNLDGPFCVSPTEAERLVTLGVAEYVVGAEVDVVDDYTQYKFEPMKEYAIELGMDEAVVKKVKSKKDLIELIDAFTAENEDDNAGTPTDDETPPKVDAQDVE